MKTALFSMLMMLSTMTLRAAERTAFDLTTLLGETYHHCRIIKVTPAALTVVYDNGVTKVPFELLGDTWRELYHYDPDKAQKYQEHEEQKRLETEARVRELKRGMELARNDQMNELIKAENQRVEMEKKLAKEQAESDAESETKPAPAAPTTPPAPPRLAPFPGDPVIPPSPPISNIYTPGQTTSGIDDSNYPISGFTSGFPYSYGPGYGYPPVTVTPAPSPSSTPSGSSTQMGSSTTIYRLGPRVLGRRPPFPFPPSGRGPLH